MPGLPQGAGAYNRLGFRTQCKYGGVQYFLQATKGVPSQWHRGGTLRPLPLPGQAAGIEETWGAAGSDFPG
jgi:hypothetical protein